MRILILCLLSLAAGQCPKEAPRDRTRDYRDHFGPITDTEDQEFYGVDF